MVWATVMGNEMVHWEGPGWYACQQEWGRIRWWPVGTDRGNPPQTYGEGLGTPAWLDIISTEQVSPYHYTIYNVNWI